MPSTGAIVVARTGDPEVLEWRDVELGRPAAGQVLVRHTAIGLNFIDVYQRRGLYPMELPFTPGVEGAGRVEALGPEVSGLAVGDRVAYATTFPVGSYCERRLVPAEKLVKLPEAVSDEEAAAVMLKGCTVEYLVRRTYAVQPGDWVLWHAAAGGVGLLAVQWLTSIGAQVIGTVGSEEKADLVREYGCEHTILYRSESVAERVRAITDGRGVDVAYDSVGKDTFEETLNSLRRRGLFVSFGNASGPVPEFAPLLLAQKGSLFFTRAGFKDYYSNADELQEGTSALFERLQSKSIRVRIGQRFALREAAAAHAALESRTTTGATLLVPASN